MSEEKERPESNGEAAIAAVDPIAVALALGGASREDANAFLQKQASLIDLQKHHLHEQFKHLHLGIWEKQMGVILRVATMVMGLAVAGGLGFMVWQASQSNGLLVEPFSVPPDMASRGLTGEVVASRVLDRLSLMQSQTNTARPAKSYANAWGEHSIKMEIPETGISLAELDNWLRQKLGHDIRVTGEIVRNASGVTMTARAGDEGAETVSGPDDDVDTLVNKLAESIYRVTQPYRYAAYLLRHEDKPAEALPIFKRLALNGSPDDRLWSYNMWAVSVGALEGSQASLDMYRQAIAADPDAIGAYDNLAGSLGTIGRYEEALQAQKDELTHLKNGRQRYVPPATMPFAERRINAAMARLLGAYGDVLPFAEQLYRSGSPGLPAGNLLTTLVLTEIGAHQISAAQGNLAAFYPDLDPDKVPIGSARQLAMIAAAREDWKGVLSLANVGNHYLASFPRDKTYVRDASAPLLALAQAKLGNFTEANRIIGPTSGACYTCLITRAQIAELEGDPSRADSWFSQATGTGPSLPFAFYEWGRVQLQRGKPDQAIMQFTLADQKGPHFADPLEYWGEALTAKNQSHLALAKFAEAEKHAPNWGRLHLKWGEALLYTGKKDDAKAQFARAAALDLTPSEKSELSKITPHV